MKQMTIAIDAMGGDYAPEETVAGAVAASKEMDAHLILVGDENKIKEELTRHQYDTSKITIKHAPEVIGTDEVPTVAIRQKKESSLVVGLTMVKEGQADALVSAGNTGALMAGATFIVGRIKGIERPALATMLPTTKGFVFLLDSGANVDCKPSYLVQFAKMGSVYMEHVLHITNPTVGLVNIGAEKEKGNALTKEAHEMLEAENINFIGNVEPREIPHGQADIVVCDGFVGNVILKFAEGLATGIFSKIKTEITRTTFDKLAAGILKPAFKRVKAGFDSSEQGGAPLLGLKSLVVKAHGNSDATAIKNAVRQCTVFIENDIVSKIENKL